MNKNQIEVEKDDAIMQRKKKMFMCIIHCLHSQHCYIHFISTEVEKLGYVFYSTVTEFINCLHSNKLANHYILYSLWLVAEAEVAEVEPLISWQYPYDLDIHSPHETMIVTVVTTY
jgi:hypothetical protein